MATPLRTALAASILPLVAGPASAALLANETTNATLSVSGFAASNGDQGDARDDYNTTDDRAGSPDVTFAVGPRSASAYTEDADFPGIYTLRSEAQSRATMFAESRTNGVSLGTGHEVSGEVFSTGNVERTRAGASAAVDYAFDLGQSVDYSLSVSFEPDSFLRNSVEDVRVTLVDTRTGLTLAEADEADFEDESRIDLDGTLAAGSYRLRLEHDLTVTASDSDFFRGVGSNSRASNVFVGFDVVPEPASFAIAAAGGLLLLRRRCA